MKSKEFDIKMMQRCIQLAANGHSFVEPNPYVGCVIVHENKIIGEGFHQRFGSQHAEVNAIASVKDKKLLKSSTLYVNLEPCSHYGKTPPCSDLIIDCKIPRVVVGSLDPNPLVSGSGIKRLKDNGIAVEHGLCEEECRNLNRVFFHFHMHESPYITLKWAQTTDGFLDKVRTNDKAKVNWITSPALKTLVHRWRSEYQAIMIGANTIINDAAQLDNRYWHGSSPDIVTIDRDLSLDLSTYRENTLRKIWVFTEKNAKDDGNIKYVQLDMAQNLSDQILKTLRQNNIQSLFVEGGSSTINLFLQSGRWNEIRRFTGKKKFKEGLKAPLLSIVADSTIEFTNEILEIFSQKESH